MPDVSATVQHHRPRNAGIVDAGGGYVSSILTGLINYWLLGEASGTRADSVGSSTLTSNNSVAQGTGINGNCASFTAASSMSLSHSGAPFSINANKTISLWIKPTSTGVNATQKGFISVGSSASDGISAWNIGISHSSGKLFVYEQTSKYHDGGTTLSASTWYHIVWTRTSNASILYLNGSSHFTWTSDETGGNNGTLWIGTGFSSFYDGLIDEVGFWSRGLTAAEVTALYTAGTGAFYPYFA